MGLKRRPTLGVSMIVRNERPSLPHALETVVNLADQLVVTDTGSEDSTPSLARRYGAYVMDVPWENDFSKARNQSLEALETDWILVLDADEQLSSDAVELLPRFLAETSADVLALPHLTVSRKGQWVRFEHALRLFRNHKGFHYKYALPERLQYKGKRALFPLPIHHHGFSMPPEALTGRVKRFRALLHQQMQDQPKNPIFPQMLAFSAFWSGKRDLALEMAQKAWNLARKAPYEPRSYLTAAFLQAAIYLKLGRLDQAIRLLDACEEIDPDYLDAKALRVQWCQAKRKPDDALAVARSYLDRFKKLLDHKAEVLSTPLYTYGLAGEMALLSAQDHFREDHDQDAHTLLDFTLEHGNDNPLCVAKLVELVLKQRDLSTLLSFCRKHYTVAQLWNQSFVHLYKRKNLDALRKVIRERNQIAQTAGPGFDKQSGGPFLLSAASLAEQLNQQEQAMDLYHESLTLSDPPRKSVLRLAQAYYHEQRYDEAVQVLLGHVNLNQPDYDVLGLLTLLHFHCNKDRELDKAVKLASSRMGISTALPLSTPEELAERIHELATRLWQQDWPSAASYYYLLETKLRPQFMPAWKGLAETRYAINDLDGAIAALEHTLTIQPSRGDLWMLLSHWYEDQGQDEAASLCRKKAEEITIFLVKNQLMQAENAKSLG